MSRRPPAGKATRSVVQAELRPLLRLLRCKNPRAATLWLHQQYARSLLAYLVSVTRDPAMAEDLLQDLFLEIQERIEDIDPRRIPGFRGSIADLGGYLIGMARNLWRRQRAAARAQRRGGAHVHVSLGSIPEPSADPEPAVEAEADAADVHRALARLAAPDADVLLRRYAAGEQYGAIGGALGLSEAGAKSRERRAKERLRRAMYVVRRKDGARPTLGAD